MGREVRMVPKDWQHPVDERGRYIALLGGSFSQSLAEWQEEKEQWDKGFRRDYSTGNGYKPKDADDCKYSFDEWNGSEPRQENYMPEFEPGTATYLMMYETCSEGTPISPAFETPEELAHWLADNGASAFGDMTATYEQWLATCQRGWAVSAIGVGGKLQSGVAGMAED